MAEKKKTESEKIAEKSKTAEKAKPVGEKKESARSSVKKNESLFGKGIPLYLVLLLVVLAVLIGIAFSVLTKKPEQLNPVLTPPIEDNNLSSNGMLNGYFVYSKDCRICSSAHSFFGLLNTNKIEFEFERAELNTALGKQIIENMPSELQEVPVLLIDPNTVTDRMHLTVWGKTSRLIDWLYSNFRKDRLNGYFIIPESSFDSLGHTTLLLNRNCGGSEQVSVSIFTDPYCSECIQSIEKIRYFEKMFDDKNVSFNFEFADSADSQKMYETFGVQTTTFFSRYLLCIKDNRENLLKFENEAYAVYCDLNGNNVLDEGELENCSKSKHYGKPFTEDELALIASKTISNSDEIKTTCVPNAQYNLQLSKDRGSQFNVNSAPAAVVDCKYKGHVFALDKMICAANPKLEACGQN